MTMNGGAKTWYFPDGYLPEKIDNGEMEAHEALMLLNTNKQEADVLIDIYFSSSIIIQIKRYYYENLCKYFYDT